MVDVQHFFLAVDGEKKISNNFKIKEFKCKDGSNNIFIDVWFVRARLQDIRSHFGKPMTINSAYRTPEYNAKVGGARSSYHMNGRAFDITVKGVPLDEICEYAEKIGVKGIIRYNTFVHLDSREQKYFAINNNGKVTPVSSFYK